MSESHARYRMCIILMIVGLQLTVLGLLGFVAELGLFLLLLYIGPILTFSAAAYGLSDVLSSQ